VKERFGVEMSLDHVSNYKSDLANRPAATDPSWLAWNGGAVAKPAQAACNERSLPSGHLDPSRLAVLADALEEAGCSVTEVFDHLRGPGPHVRGCWVVDLLLGKG
jgi:hypothetical protein